MGVTQVEANVVGELGGILHADDDRGHEAPAERPRDRETGHGNPGLGCDPLDALGDRESAGMPEPRAVDLHPGGESGALCRVLHAPVLPREQTGAEGAEAEQAHAAVHEGGDDLALVLAVDEVVEELAGRQLPVVPVRGDSRGFRDLPPEEVADAAVADLALPGQVVQRPQRFLEGSHRVGAVDVVEVDVVGLHAPEARLARGDQVHAGSAEGVRGAPRREVALRRDEDLVAPDLRQEAADDVLRFSARVDVRGIQEVPAAVHVRLHDPVRRRFVASPSGGAERHRAQRDARHEQARAAEVPVFHDALTSRDWIRTAGTASRTPARRSRPEPITAAAPCQSARRGE